MNISELKFWSFSFRLTCVVFFKFQLNWRKTRRHRCHILTHGQTVPVALTWCVMKRFGRLSLQTTHTGLNYCVMYYLIRFVLLIALGNWAPSVAHVFHNHLGHILESLKWLVEAYLWSRRSRSEAELRLEGAARLHPDSRPLVLGAGGDGAVGGGAGRGLPLEELQDGLDVWGHLGLQSEGQTEEKRQL